MQEKMEVRAVQADANGMAWQEREDGMLRQKMGGEAEEGGEAEKRLAKERIRAFDRELMAANTDLALSSKILYTIMGVFGCFMMVFPVGAAFDPDLRVLHVLAWMFLGMAMMARIQPYVYILGDARRVSAALAYIPVEPALLCLVRREYLRRYLQKIGVVCLLVQQLGALLNGAWSVWNLLYPVGVVFSLYLAGVVYIGRK